MTIKIEMYNTYFGDCYILKDRNSNLLVDFGIHSRSSPCKGMYIDRQKLIENIADDIAYRYENPSVLITHFHTDHICGLIYMHKRGLKKFKDLFNKIYIPNIWGNPFTVVTSLLEEMVLSEQLKRSKLPNTVSSLFDLIEFLCNNARNVRLLSRGVTFENDKYITLWPPRDTCKNEYEVKLEELNISKNLIEDLYSLSKDICNYVQKNLEQEENRKNFNIEEINIFKERYEGIVLKYKSQLESLIEFEELNKPDQNISEKLNKLGHNINVIFQNKEDGNENILFTGDAEISHIKEIVSSKTDPLLLMHRNYKFIKIPHHGTENHYYDF